VATKHYERECSDCVQATGALSPYVSAVASLLFCNCSPRRTQASALRMGFFLHLKTTREKVRWADCARLNSTKHSSLSTRYHDFQAQNSRLRHPGRQVLSHSKISVKSHEKMLRRKCVCMVRFVHTSWLSGSFPDSETVDASALTGGDSRFSQGFCPHGFTNLDLKPAESRLERTGLQPSPSLAQESCL